MAAFDILKIRCQSTWSKKYTRDWFKFLFNFSWKNRKLGERERNGDTLTKHPVPPVELCPSADEMLFVRKGLVWNRDRVFRTISREHFSMDHLTSVIFLLSFTHPPLLVPCQVGYRPVQGFFFSRHRPCHLFLSNVTSPLALSWLSQRQRQLSH